MSELNNNNIIFCTVLRNEDIIIPIIPLKYLKYKNTFYAKKKNSLFGLFS